MHLLKQFVEQTDAAADDDESMCDTSIHTLYTISCSDKNLKCDHDQTVITKMLTFNEVLPSFQVPSTEDRALIEVMFQIQQ